MENGRYNYIGNEVWKILIKEKIDKLPIDIVALCNNIGIEVFKSKISRNGYSIITQNKKIITYNQNINKKENIRYIIGHELGHIMLNQENENYSEKEHEANLFSRKILAPLGIIYNIGVNTPDDISRLCEVSKTVALKRYCRLIKENTIHEYGENSLENEVIHNFDSFFKNRKI